MCEFLLYVGHIFVLFERTFEYGDKQEVAL